MFKANSTVTKEIVLNEPLLAYIIRSMQYINSK